MKGPLAVIFIILSSSAASAQSVVYKSYALASRPGVTEIPTWPYLSSASFYNQSAPNGSIVFAQSSTGWIEFFQSARGHFYYSPSSIERTGQIVRVKYYVDAPIEGKLVVWKNEIDCSRRTITAVSAEEFNWQTRAFIRSYDLGGDPPQGITSGTMPYDLAARVCRPQ